MPHPIIEKYKQFNRIVNRSALDDRAIDVLVEIYTLCQSELAGKQQVALDAGNGIAGKNYISFEENGRYSRPCNIDIYTNGLSTTASGQNKVEVFFENVRNRAISNQSADEITDALYVISMGFCCSADFIGSGARKVCGTFFEKLIGYLYARHLNDEPSTQMDACELDGTTIKIPTDFIFNLGAGRPKFHVPVKTSTRDRCVQVWAQQRVLDGAYGVGRFLCLLTCIGETELDKDHMRVDDVCVPNQWINYQLFIAQIKRAYYLDIPQRYDELNRSFPRIHVKRFGEFFHESDDLID